ncbi:MAG: RNA polymerase sigma factor [Bacteroidota bacterium]
MDRAEQDKRAIDRLKAGETAAFRELVDRYKDDALSVAISIVKDASLAEDILQEAFIKAFDKINTFQYQSSFYTWLYRIVVNRCYNELRKQKKLTDIWEEKGTEREQTADWVQSQELKAIVQQVLLQMKPDEALVLRLFYLYEQSVEEVTEITGFGKSKVKVTLHRGRKNFEKKLKRYLGKEIEDL